MLCAYTELSNPSLHLPSVGDPPDIWCVCRTHNQMSVCKLYNAEYADLQLEEARLLRAQQQVSPRVLWEVSLLPTPLMRHV